MLQDCLKLDNKLTNRQFDENGNIAFGIQNTSKYQA